MIFPGESILWDRLSCFEGFPDSLVDKESTCNAGDPGFIPGSGRSPGEGIGHSLQHSGLENSTDCIVHEIAESDTTERLSLSCFETFNFVLAMLTEPINSVVIVSGGHQNDSVIPIHVSLSIQWT